MNPQKINQDENYDGDKSNDAYKLLLVTPNKILFANPVHQSKEKSINKYELFD